MHTQYSAGELNQNNDDMSYVTRFTGKTGTIVYTQHTRFNITEEFWHAVEKTQSESKTKRTGAASGHLQDFMYSIINQPSKWEDLEHCNMTHAFWGEIGTYLGQHAKNKTMVKFPRGKKTASKKGVISRQVSRTANSTKDVSQSRLSNESDILLTTFVPAESTQDKNKE